MPITSQNILHVDVPENLDKKIMTGLSWFDDLTSGITETSVNLLSGSAGAGKTTLFAQVADALTGNDHICLFVSSEQSIGQVAHLCKRLKLKNGFLFKNYDKLTDIISHTSHLRERNKDKSVFLFVDSISDLAKNNSKEAMKITTVLKKVCEVLRVTGFFMIQETKNGSYRGGSELLHAVDAFFRTSVINDSENERQVTSTKNRFGPTKTIKTSLTSTGHVTYRPAPPPIPSDDSSQSIGSLFIKKYCR